MLAGMAIDRLTAGDTLDFIDSVPDYPPANGWTYKYCLNAIFTTPVQAAITLTASVEGTTYRIQAAPATTTDWKAGLYSWTRWVEKTGAKHSVPPNPGGDALAPILRVLPDLSAVGQGYDPRSPARKALDACDEALVGWAGTNGHVLEYEIAGRRMRYAERADVMAMRDRLKAEVWREDAAAAMAQGLPNPRNVQVRFGRV
jgi:hypothetical protein